MISADVPTLLLVIVVVSFILAATVSFASLGEGMRSLRLWALSMLLHGLAYFILSLRGHAPDLVSIVIGNTLLTATFSLFLYTVAGFLQRRYPSWLYWVPATAVAVLFLIFIDNQPLRLILAGLIYGSQQLLVIHAAWPRPGEKGSRGHALLILALLIVTVVMYARTVGVAAGVIQIPSLTSPGATQTITYVLALIVPLLSTVGFVFMVKVSADRQITEGKRLLDTLFDSIEESIAMVRRDGTILAINRIGAERLGRTPESLVGGAMTELVPAAIAERRMRVIGRALDSHHAEQIEDERLGRRLRINIYPVPGSEDTVVMHGTDITDSLAAEQALRHSEERYRALFENSHTVMLIIDPDSSAIVDANTAASRYYGWSPQTLRSMRITDINVLSNEEVRAEMTRAKAAKRDYFLFRHRLADGAIRDVEVFSGPIRIAGRPMLYSIIHDVSERQRGIRRTQALLDIGAVDGRLAEQEFLTRGLEHAERLTDSAIGFLHFVNDDQESIELAVWTAGALRGCTAAHDTHYPISKAGIWADCFRQKRPVVFNDYPGYRDKHGLPEGHAHLQRLISVPVIEDGQVRMMIGVGNKDGDYLDADIESVQLIGNDIWRIVRHDRAEREIAISLDQQRELNAKLEEAHNQLLQSEKMASIGQLAAGVAHEINNPVGFVTSNLGTLESYLDDIFAITDAYEAAEAAGGPLAELKTAAELRQEKDFDYLKSDIRQLMAESRDGLQRVRKIVQDLKDFSRVGDTHWQWADIHQGIESTLNVVWNELKYKSTVTRHYAPDLPQIHCLPSQLNQVFMNLLVNAAHAIEPIDGKLGEITITTRRLGEDAIQIEFRDTGKGIPEENLKRIFEPFFTTKPVGKGTGLGLSIAWGIIGKHKGHIDVTSQAGNGTTFTLTVPIDPSSGESAQPQSMIPP